MCECKEVRVLNQFIMATLNMLSSGNYDIHEIELRMQSAIEIAEGLGVKIDIPTGRKVLFQRIGKAMVEKLDGLI